MSLTSYVNWIIACIAVSILYELTQYSKFSLNVIILWLVFTCCIWVFVLIFIYIFYHGKNTDQIMSDLEDLLVRGLSGNYDDDEKKS